MIEAKIIADSVNRSGNRITTFIVSFNRFILAETNTHRILSRNSASSRAIPSYKMIARIRENPGKPVFWAKNQSGMQAKEELAEPQKTEAQQIWLQAMENAIESAEKLSHLGLHKAISNRLIEPFLYTTAIITASEWGNFFNLRAHPEAQQEFQHLAYLMLEEYVKSVPIEKKPGSWHIPFGDRYISEGLTTKQQLKIATARCARVSYLNFEGNIDHEKDYQLHDNLITSGHLSPTEHCARALEESHKVGNFVGWFQYRKTFPNENRVQFDPYDLLSKRNN